LVNHSKASGHKNVALYNLSVHIGKNLYEHKKHEKKFHDEYSLDQHQSVHSGEQSCECREYGKSFKKSSSFSVHLTLEKGLMSVETVEKLL
jgi:KRAB domain-containing zinc finger protein